MNEDIRTLVEILQELEFENWYQVPENQIESHEDEYLIIYQDHHKIC